MILRHRQWQNNLGQNQNNLSQSQNQNNLSQSQNQKKMQRRARP